MPTLNPMTIEEATDASLRGENWFLYMICVTAKSNKFWATWGNGTETSFVRYGARGGTPTTIIKDKNYSFKTALKKMNRKKDHYIMPADPEKVLEWDSGTLSFEAQLADPPPPAATAMAATPKGTVEVKARRKRKTRRAGGAAEQFAYKQGKKVEESLDLDRVVIKDEPAKPEETLSPEERLRRKMKKKQRASEW